MLVQVALSILSDGGDAAPGANAKSARVSTTRLALKSLAGSLLGMVALYQSGFGSGRGGGADTERNPVGRVTAYAGMWRLVVPSAWSATRKLAALFLISPAWSPSV